MIRARRVTHTIGGTDVLHEASLYASGNEIVGLIGPNGSGKSTLLRTLQGALRPRSGSVEIDGDALHSFTPRRRAQRIAVISQDPPDEHPVNALEWVMMGRFPHLGSFQRPSESDHAVVADAMEMVGVAHLAERRIERLSGGERQRILIARAIAQGADHVLMDEPTNHLDVRYQHELLRLLQSIQVVGVVVLHDLNLAARYCDRLVLIDQGHTIATGAPEDVLQEETIREVFAVEAERVRAADGALQLLLRAPQQHVRGERSYFTAV
jgi:iron complex transport system ATP-binding protein